MQLALYKGTRPGLPGLYNRAVRWWTRGPYSHCEIILADGLAGSASFEDGGVRIKRITFDPARWDVVKLPDHLDEGAYEWFLAHLGEKYDVMGNLRFLLPPMRDGRRRWFCSEAAAAALGLPDPWRYDPNTLASAIKFLHPPAKRGIFFA